MEKRISTANSTLAIGGVSCSANSFVVALFGVIETALLCATNKWALQNDVDDNTCIGLMPTVSPTNF